MPFRILSSLVNLIFWGVGGGHILHGLLAYLDLWASDSLVPLSAFNCYTIEEGTGFCSILHSNSGSP